MNLATVTRNKHALLLAAYSYKAAISVMLSQRLRWPEDQTITKRSANGRTISKFQHFLLRQQQRQLCMMCCDWHCYSCWVSIETPAGLT